MSITKGFQFGRYAEIEVRNFLTGEKITIPNDFEIDFQFFKSIDEVDSASVGRIQIYGLTHATYQRMYSDGGEVSLRCGYENSEIKTLFIADILRMSQVHQNSTTVTTIECSANVLNYFFGGYMSAGFRDASLVEVISNVCTQMKVGFALGLHNVPPDMIPLYEEYMETASMYVDFVGTPQDLLTAIAYNFDFQVTDIYNKETGNKVKLFVQRSGGVSEVIRNIDQGYAKIDRTSEKFKQVQSDEKTFNSVFITPQDEAREALVLTQDTGLKTVSMEFKIATALETQQLGANEEETQKSIEKRTEKERKEAEKKKKAEEKDKKLKPKKPKINTIKVNRKFVKVVANLNPSIRPQGHVLIQSLNPDYNGIFIVRDIEFKGNNKQGSWDMTLSCEDPLGRYDTALTQRQLDQNESQVQINGELGDTTSYGAE